MERMSMKRVRWSHRLVMLVVVVAAAFGLAIAAGAEGHPLAGTWDGVIEIPGQPLGLIVHLSQDERGGWTGTADIPAQGASGLVLKDIELQDGRVVFAFAAIPAHVEATLSADGTAMEGTFSQSGLAFPFHAVLRDAGKKAAEHDPAKFEALAEFITAAMEEWQVPGLAVAIVQNGDIVFAEGFGYRDVERGLPVTPNTQFGTGSVTKSFTTVAFQMLVDEGLLSWDEPIRKVIPGFRLKDPFATEHITALDFALHRSGLPRHDSTWMFNPDLDAAAFIAAAEHLEPSAGFRTTWMYNNFGYMVLGHMIERASQQRWQDFVRERIVQPLGMENTTFSIAEMQASEDYSLAYAVIDGELENVPLNELGGAAAAGAINASILDMATWLLFHLNAGTVGDRALLNPMDVKAMHSPHFIISGGDSHIRFLSYGLGWMIDSYRGHYRVHHGGNTIGFTAHIAFLPEEQLGVAVLANAVFTSLPELLVNHVIDAMLDLEPVDWTGQYQEAKQLQAEALAGMATDLGRREGTSPLHDLAEYVGVYEHPAYGELRIALFDDQLIATYYNAVMTLEHWHYDQFRAVLDRYVPSTVPFFFETDATGHVSGVRVGFEPLTDPIPFERRGSDELHDEAYLEQFVGEYDALGLTVEVSLRSGVLVLTVPGQPPYPLEPTHPGRFVFRDVPGFGVLFTLNDDGEILRAVLIQPHGNIEMVKK